MSRGIHRTGKSPGRQPPHVAFSSRTLDKERPHWITRTSASVEDRPRSHQGKAEQPPPFCKGHTQGPHYTKYLEEKILEFKDLQDSIEVKNSSLNNQLSKAVIRNEELKAKIAELEKAQKFGQPPPPPRFERGMNTTSSGGIRVAEIGTSTEKPKCSECPVQTVEQVTMYVECGVGGDEQLVAVTRAELESLENNMKMLRDAVRAKEDMWNEAVEREQAYAERFKQLSVELVTARQLSDSRFDELNLLASKLAEKQGELKSIQKDYNSAKKTLLKYQKHLKMGKNEDHADNYENHNKASDSKPHTPRTPTSPHYPISKPKSRGAKDKRSSQNNSPRKIEVDLTQKIRENYEEPGEVMLRC